MSYIETSQQWIALSWTSLYLTHAGNMNLTRSSVCH